jgi:hypothetical protein
VIRPGPAPDRAAAVGQAPGDLERDRGGEHDQEDRLLVPADQAAAEGSLGERQDGQRRPPGAGHEAVGVPAPPEVHPAPGGASQRGQPVNGQIPPLGQVRCEVEQYDDGGTVQRSRPAGPGQQAVRAPLQRGVGGQVRGGPPK